MPLQVHKHANGTGFDAPARAAYAREEIGAATPRQAQRRARRAS
jgi:hypothetical protein